MIGTTDDRDLQVHFRSTHAVLLPGLAEEREQLDRVLRHPEISRSTSLVRFLTFICGMYFEHRSDEIREHTIAVKALGRKESTFDSQVDPIVRVTARALRKRLRDYYEGEGRTDAIEIVIPLGHYIPQFVWRRANPPAETEFSAPKMPPRGSIEADLVETVLVDQEVEQEETLPCCSAVAALADPGPGAPHAEVLSPEIVPVSKPLFRRRSFVFTWMALLLVAIFVAGIALGRHSLAGRSDHTLNIAWGDPVWSDEFAGAAQQMPDPAKWTYDVGNQNSWGNHELETYCSPAAGAIKGCDPRHPNAFLDGSGHLVLRAQKDADGNWTSARMTTRGLQNFQYGRIEARMKLPVGTGLWPAFWLLGADLEKAGWPAAGTVDIAENVGLNARTNGLGPSMIRSSLHAPGFSGGDSLRRNYKFSHGERIDDDSFHTYGIIWSPGMIQFYVDDPANIYFVQNVSEIPEKGQWVFDKPFYLVLNLAVGGDWSGDPDNTTPSPAEILVDYVRVYRIPTMAPTTEWHATDVVSGTMSSGPIVIRAQKGTGRVYLSCAAEPAPVVCALDSSTVDLTTGEPQQDTLTIFTEGTGPDGAKALAPPGKYKLTITATTMSGNHSESTQDFQVTPAGR
jgi:beta-glucanase (GH16 family)